MLRQISTGVIKEIEIEALGRLSDKNIEGLKLAILKGALSVNLDGITFVNAPHVAKERGIKVTELKCEESGAYIDKLLIKMKTETETKIIAGTVLQGNIPAIIQIDNYPVNIRPENHSIITFHRDQPGIVAQVSQILWEGQINISSMNLGRTKDSARAVMVISVDGAVDEESLKKIESINGIDVAKYIRLKGKI
jgi:D-3-phosphoglycerate dehydrogenase